MKFDQVVVATLVCCQAAQTFAIRFSKPNFLNIPRGGSTILSEEDRSSSPLFALSKGATTEVTKELYVQKRDGSTDLLDEKKVRKKLQSVVQNL